MRAYPQMIIARKSVLLWGSAQRIRPTCHRRRRRHKAKILLAEISYFLDYRPIDWKWATRVLCQDVEFDGKFKICALSFDPVGSCSSESAVFEKTLDQHSELFEGNLAEC